MRADKLTDLLHFLQRLREAHIYYRLSTPTESAVMVEVAVPGERWEIEFHGDGEITSEVFISEKDIRGAEAFEDLFRRFSD